MKPSLLALLLIVASCEWRASSKHAPISSQQRKWHQQLRHRFNRELQQKSLPASRCKPDCPKYGVCNEEIGVCFCPRHRSGDDCSVETGNVQDACSKWGFAKVDECFREDRAMCLNECNGKGKCIGGFCHCDPGYWGTDCSLSHAMDVTRGSGGSTSGSSTTTKLEGPFIRLLADEDYTPRKRGPRIYVYELPGEFNMHGNLNRLDRPLYLLFWQRLLSAGVRTPNGDEADYYFIPVKSRIGAGDSQSVINAIAFVRQHWPWYNKLHGHKHLIIQTGDMGRFELTHAAREVTANLTFLTHWGLHQYQPSGSWPASHRPGQDIVIPIFMQPSLVLSYGMHASPLHPAAPPSNKTLTFFFAGRICGDRKQPLPGVFPNCDLVNRQGRPSTLAGKGYSAGTRQRIFHYHANRTGYKIVTSTKTYAKDMARSTFCLAPTGAGHGKRNVLVSVLGCVPVTTTDFVHQPFQPELDWSRFSIHLPEADIPQMHDMLAAVTPDKLKAMQRALWCGAQHLFWSTVYGAILGEDGRYDAFETVMEILRVRRDHPGAKPEDYARLDKEFDAFMKCETKPLQSPRDLCTHTTFDKGGFQCKNCRHVRQRLLYPGGAICCAEPNLAKCPRLWE